MPPVLTLLGVSTVHVTLATMEMESSAQVSYHYIIILVTATSRFLYHRFEQILMSATQTMEDVNTTVLIPLAASTAVVTLATSWMGID